MCSPRAWLTDFQFEFFGERKTIVNDRIAYLRVGHILRLAALCLGLLGDRPRNVIWINTFNCDRLSIKCKWSNDLGLALSFSLLELGRRESCLRIELRRFTVSFHLPRSVAVSFLHVCLCLWGWESSRVCSTLPRSAQKSVYVFFFFSTAIYSDSTFDTFGQPPNGEMLRAATPHSVL